jgi:ABC-2 type transport system permease protein
VTDTLSPAINVGSTMPRRATAWRMLRHQARYDLLRSWRNRQTRFFAVFLPVILLIMFTTLFGKYTVNAPGGPLKQNFYYIPGLTALGIINAACLNLAIAVVTERQNGILKRRRSKPVPAWVLVGGRGVTALVSVLVVTAVLLVLGGIGYGVLPRAAALPGLACTLVVGTAAFACIGYGMVPFLRDPESAQTTTQAFMLPLYFISTIFLPPRLVPPTLRHIAQWFPVEHLSHSLFITFNPHLTGSGFDGTDLAVITAWGLAGLAVALRRFRWAPTTAKRTRRVAIGYRRSRANHFVAAVHDRDRVRGRGRR